MLSYWPQEPDARSVAAMQPNGDVQVPPAHWVVVRHKVWANGFGQVMAFIGGMN